jgi:opacity protein-like surface antigen
VPVSSGRSPALAEKGPFYVGFYAGGTKVQDISEDLADKIEVETSYSFGGMVGYTLRKIEGADVRFELEAAYRKNDADKWRGFDLDGDVESLAVMFNTAVDFVNRTSLTPYVMGGIGGARVSLDDLEAMGITIIDDDDTVFAYQFGGGLAFNLTKSLVLDLGYRYFATANLEITAEDDSDGKINYDTHNLMLGLRYLF